MKRILLIFTICLLQYCMSSPKINKCKQGDTECIQQLITTLVKHKPEGYTAFNIPKIDPLHSDEMIFKQNGPINIKMRLYDIDFVGLSKAKFEKVSGFTKDPNGRYEVHFKVPNLDVFSNYEVQGQLLVLPITAKGHSNITIVDIDGAVNFTGIGVEKEGKTFLKIQDFDYVQEIKQGTVAFTNAFIGNYSLGDTTVQFKNENWMGVLDDLELSMRQAFGKELRNIIEHVFDHTPYEELFDH